MALSNSHKPTRPPTQVVGNLSNQKYEAVCNVRHHFESVLGALPSKETSRWKYEKNYQLVKHQGKRRMLDKSLKEDNAMLSDRIYEIVTEDRERRTHEFCPGLRVGRGGIVIDCYESSCQPFSEYKKYIRKKIRHNKEEKIDLDNVYIKKYIDASKASVSNKDLRKSYESNRVLYNFLASRTPHTALHLGILKKAKFELRKSDSKDGYIHRLSSPPRSPTRKSSDDRAPSPKADPTATHHEPNSNPNPVVVIESRLEMDVGRELLSRQRNLQPLFTECARYGSITSLQLPRRQPPQPTHIVLPRPRTAPALRSQLLAQQAEDEDGDEAVQGKAEEQEEIAQEEQPQPLRGIRHLQALRKSVSFENNASNDGQQQLGEVGEMNLPGGQWSALLDSDSMLLAASFQRLTTHTTHHPTGSANAAPNGAKPLQQELGDELSLLYESLFSRRDQLLSAAQQQEQLEQQQVHEQVLEDVDALEALRDSTDQLKSWDSCCSDRSSISGGGGGSLLLQDESQPSTHRSHRPSLHSTNLSTSGTAALADPPPSQSQQEAELLLDPPQQQLEEELDRSVLALTYNHLDPSTYQLLLQPYFPSRDTHLLRVAEDSGIAEQGAGELAENSWISVLRVPASSECSSRLGRAWQLKNSQRSASVCSEMSAPMVAAVEGRMKLKVAHRQSMICQCAVQPRLFVNSGGDSNGGVVEWQQSDVHTISRGRVTSFLLNVLDVGVCLPGNSKPCSQETSHLTTNTNEHSPLREVSSELLAAEITSEGNNNVDHSSLTNNYSHSPNHSSVINGHFSLATSVGLLVELVPVLSQDQGTDKNEEMDKIGQLYCRAILSMQQLQGLASRPGFSDLHFAVSELLQYPVDVEPPTVFTPSSKSSHGSRSKGASQHTHLQRAAASSTSTASHLHMPLYSLLGSVLDADTELQLFQLLAGAVLLQVDSSGHATMGFSSHSES